MCSSIAILSRWVRDISFVPAAPLSLSIMSLFAAALVSRALLSTLRVYVCECARECELESVLSHFVENPACE